MHNGLTNEITFTHKDKKFVLHPLTPTQVEEDQTQMKLLKEKEQKEKSEAKRKEEFSSQKIAKKESHIAFKNQNKRTLYLQQSFISPIYNWEKNFVPSFRVEKFEQVFQPLQEELFYANILAQLNIVKTYELEYHASKEGLVMALLKDGFPIASLKINHHGTTFNYSIYHFKALLHAFYAWGQHCVPKKLLNYYHLKPTYPIER